jgi:hypothetical protein
LLRPVKIQLAGAMAKSVGSGYIDTTDNQFQTESCDWY